MEKREISIERIRMLRREKEESSAKRKERNDKILEMIATGRTVRYVANKFGLSHTMVANIVTNALDE